MTTSPKAQPVTSGAIAGSVHRSAPRRPVRAVAGGARPLLLVLGIVLGGCNDLTQSPGLPAGTPDPSTYNTAAGAVGMYGAVIYELEHALPQYIVDSGLLTDELEDPNTGASQGLLLQANQAVTNPLDERFLSTGVTVASYSLLQGVRTYANQAIGALAAYDTAAADTSADTAKTLRGAALAVEGYAEIMLADLFCSGVPLSTLDFQKDFTYKAGSSNIQVYQDALAKFDTAVTLAGANDTVLNLARVGQGRALLDLGQYAAAAAAVTAVPTQYQYKVDESQLFEVQSDTARLGVNILSTFFSFEAEPYNPTAYRVTFFPSAIMSNVEGRNGLPYRNGDPRTPFTVLCIPNPPAAHLNDGCSDTLAAPTAGLGSTLTLASGVEARLIQAEAALNGVATGQGSWLDQLNALRSTVGLAPVADPIDPGARIDTLFTERAYWLYLTGHRQGDLRRLLRNYAKYQRFTSQQYVYPTGKYLAPGLDLYGPDFVAPIPTSEYTNPLFHGCNGDEP